MTIWAYIDESGHPDDPNIRAFALGGCLGFPHEWNAFEEEWKHTLLEEGVSWFHMKDFENSKGQFSKWTKEQHQAFLGRLIEIMDRHVSAYVGFAKPFPACKNRGTLRELYYNGRRVCIHAALRFARTEKVNLVIAKQEEISQCSYYEDHATLRQHFPQLGSIEIDLPKNRVPLQAADLVAYELFKQVSSPQRQRWPFKQLMRKKPIFYI
jgi:hypothetical protein